MIRTLHHMADPALVLAQVWSVLSDKAIFILEYANKHNLKAIFRYWTKKQDWNPFKEDAVEFARLNFDFHPRAIQKWLTDNHFLIQKQLTVSHFRMNLLKKVIPPKLLARLDGLLQPSGALFQLTPSVFVRSQAIGNTVPVSGSEFFKCPECGRGLPEFTGKLRCPGCGHIWEQKDGIYDFRLKT